MALKYPDSIDSVDRLFARLERKAPPAGFLERALAEAQRRRRIAERRFRALGVGYLAVLALLGAFAYQIGLAVFASDAGEVLAAAFSEPSLLSDVPEALALSLADSLPWVELSVLGLLVVAAWAILRAAGSAGVRRADDLTAA